MELTRDFIDTMAEGAIILDGLEECIIGITEECGNGPRLLYSVKSIINKLMDDFRFLNLCFLKNQVFLPHFILIHFHFLKL